MPSSIIQGFQQRLIACFHC